MFGGECEFDVIGYKLWRGGASLVADSFRRSRVFLAGDAVHLFTSSAGLGYCTGIDGVANLGWKLAAVVKGWGGKALLDSYEIECRPEAMRRTSFAAECAERLAIFKPSSELEQNTAEGARLRAEAAIHFAAHLPFQYDIPGINFGARYDDSPIIAADRSALPALSPNSYVPSAKPGGRAPHVWLRDGRSLFDAFGFDFTLMKLSPRANDADAFSRAAAKMNIPLTVVELASPALRELYEADLVLVRPDQYIAWRGSGTAPGLEDILKKISGRG
jgi:hypothetical protein